MTEAQANVVELYPSTRGKRILFVTSRTDPALQEELSRGLQAKHFKFLVVPPDSPSRVQSMAASIRAGSFDAVLFAEALRTSSTSCARRRAS